MPVAELVARRIKEALTVTVDWAWAGALAEAEAVGGAVAGAGYGVVDGAADDEISAVVRGVTSE